MDKINRSVLNPPPPMQLDIASLSNLVCKSCKNEMFWQCFFLKKLPGVMSRSGRDEMIIVQIFICRNCGLEFNREPPVVSQVQ